MDLPRILTAAEAEAITNLGNVGLLDGPVCPVCQRFWNTRHQVTCSTTYPDCFTDGAAYLGGL